ncbi:hypothetical protein J11TS1_26260 [Oceanobacillus sp. J11TS1]|nr:hypothetical protein J11TS1_26260 [Oceanobacillus sp. J11TS1]
MQHYVQLLYTNLLAVRFIISGAIHNSYPEAHTIKAAFFTRWTTFDKLIDEYKNERMS